MDNNNADMSLDIVGYAAKTEELKAELLLGVAEVFRNTAMGSRALPSEERFADMLSLMLMLANRCGADMQAIGREMLAGAKAGLAREDAFSRDHRAVIGFVNGENRR